MKILEWDFLGKEDGGFSLRRKREMQEGREVFGEEDGGFSWRRRWRILLEKKGGNGGRSSGILRE